MDTVTHLRRLFDYDDWANREVARLLKAAGATPPRTAGLLAHILGAEWLWICRMKQEKSPVAVWPDWTLNECEAQISRLRPTWQGYFSGLTAPDLSRLVAYTNSKGEPWTSAVEDILTHVAMHSVYHRGQIASLMRAAGGTPAYTDFIHCVRQGLIE